MVLKAVALSSPNEVNYVPYRTFVEHDSQEKSLKNLYQYAEFQKFSVLRDQELEVHFQHLKIETAEE